MTIEEIIGLETEQKFYTTKEQLMEFYRSAERPSANVVILKDVAFITFDINTNAQFILKGIRNNNEIDFIENKTVVVLDDHDKNFLEFLMLEVWQGKTLGQKLFRLFQIIVLIYVFNVLIMFFGSEKNISAVCASLLSAVSVFIAIFSVFTANQNHFERAEKQLFENGKIVYYFSMDRNLTTSGLVAVFSALFGIIIAADTSGPFVAMPWNYIHNHDYFSRKFLLVVFTNVAFIMTYITLRSLIEFYVKRPARYQIGLMKDKFLNPK